jgi:hypothetical protein
MAAHPYGSRTQAARAAQADFQTLSANTDMNGFMALSPGEATYESRVEAAEGDEFRDMAVLLPSQAFDNRIREIRRRIKQQREELNDLIDYDLTGY